jgi:hypothetical protein
MSEGVNELGDVLERTVASLAGASAGGAAEIATANVARQLLEQLVPSGGLLQSVSGGSVVSGLLSWLNPLAGGLAALFGGKKTEESAPLVKFTPPARQSYETGFGAETSGVVEQVGRDEFGAARPLAGTVGSQVVVQVQAMDSQSFLERTSDIAAAVKRALLESGELSSLIRE